MFLVSSSGRIAKVRAFRQHLKLHTECFHVTIGVVTCVIVAVTIVIVVVNILNITVVTNTRLVVVLIFNHNSNYY